MGASPELQSGSAKKVGVIQLDDVVKHAVACMTVTSMHLAIRP